MNPYTSNDFEKGEICIAACGHLAEELHYIFPDPEIPEAIRDRLYQLAKMASRAYNGRRDWNQVTQ